MAVRPSNACTTPVDALTIVSRGVASWDDMATTKKKAAAKAVAGWLKTAAQLARGK